MSQRDLILEEARAKLQTHSYYEFVKGAFKVLHPGKKFVDNWHIEYLCNTMQDVVERVGHGLPKKRDVIINVPPRSLKSIVCTICIVPWAWIKYPHLNFVCSSYSSTLSMDHSTKARRIIDSSWYQKNWGGIFDYQDDENTKTYYVNTKMGSRAAVSTGGTVTGKGGDIVIMDDPQNPKGTISEVDRISTIDFFKNTLSSRIDDTSSGTFVLVQQRLHELDLTGHLLKEEGENRWLHICLPAQEDECIKPERLRKYYREGLLFPARFSQSFLELMLERMFERGFAGQYNQRPAPAGGMIIKGAWFKRFSYAELPPRLVVNFYVDTAYTDKEENDPCCILAYAHHGNNLYILGISVRRMELPEFSRHLVDYTLAMGRTDESRVYIEPKASGKSIVQVLRKIEGVNAIEDEPPTASKIERANASTAKLEAGLVFLPKEHDPKYYGAWVHAFIHECESFPAGAHDDQVDCLTGAIRKARTNQWAFLT